LCGNRETATGKVAIDELCLKELCDDCEMKRQAALRALKFIRARGSESFDRYNDCDYRSVAKLEAALDLESSAFGLGGSTPPAPTNIEHGELAEWSKALQC
jgi:hypothetical protein